MGSCSLQIPSTGERTFFINISNVRKISYVIIVCVEDSKGNDLIFLNYLGSKDGYRVYKYYSELVADIENKNRMINCKPRTDEMIDFVIGKLETVLFIR